MNDGSRSALRRAGCRLCGGLVDLALRASDRTHGGERTFDYERCRECGGLQIAAVPADLERFYGDTYYTARERPVSLHRAGGRFGVRRSLSRLRLALRSGPLARIVSGRRYGRFEWFRQTATTLDAAILDVGCGSGRLLFRMRRDGFSRLMGIDPRLPVERVAAARGLDGLALLACEPSQLAGTYHLVMAHHSFEHALDPLATWQALVARMAPGGWLLLRVPLADGWAAAHFGADWAQLDAPRHLQLPTRRTIERLAASSGLEIVRVDDDSGPFQITGSRRAPDWPTPWLARPLRVLAARWQARALRRSGRGDQAVFYLRRVNARLT